MYQHVLICSVGPVTLCVYRTLYDCVMLARGHIYYVGCPFLSRETAMQHFLQHIATQPLSNGEPRWN